MVQALQTVGKDHAVAASRLARRLTDYNEGPDAEAPIIVVGDVASSRQTLATTVATLVQAGALTADSTLEGGSVTRSTSRPNDPAPAPPPRPPARTAAAPGASPGRRARGLLPGDDTPRPSTAVLPLSPRVAPAAPPRSVWPYRRPLTTSRRRRRSTRGASTTASTPS
jgi:hypothetical protein